MKERPILFSGPMVRAILDGRKTQTRRVVKLQPDGAVTGAAFTDTRLSRHGVPLPLNGHYWQWVEGDLGRACFRCPYGVPGDRLWVRERHFGYGRWMRDKSRRADGWKFDYAHGRLVSFDPPEHVRTERDGKDGWYLRPGMFLHRDRARLTLEVVNVRVERLQEISEADAKAEGVEAVIGKKIHGWTPHVLEFALLWEQINGIKSWDPNPWVWVVEFGRLNVGRDAGILAA